MNNQQFKVKFRDLMKFLLNCESPEDDTIFGRLHKKLDTLGVTVYLDQRRELSVATVKFYDPAHKAIALAVAEDEFGSTIYAALGSFIEATEMEHSDFMKDAIEGAYPRLWIEVYREGDDYTSEDEEEEEDSEEDEEEEIPDEEYPLLTQLGLTFGSLRVLDAMAALKQFANEHAPYTVLHNSSKECYVQLKTDTHCIKVAPVDNDSGVGYTFVASYVAYVRNPGEVIAAEDSTTEPCSTIEEALAELIDLANAENDEEEDSDDEDPDAEDDFGYKI